MSNRIRNKIARRVFEYCSSKSNPINVDEVGRRIKIKQLTKQSEPVLLQLPIISNDFNAADKNYLFEPNDELLSSFKDDDCVSSVKFDVSGNTLEFSLDQNSFVENVLRNILENKEFWKLNTNPEKIIVEFSSPNIAKPFHAGHLRSTVIGNFVANMYQSLGHQVIALNYLGDWGTQFGLLNVGYDMFGSKEELAKNPIEHLFKIYVSINGTAKNDPKIFERAKKSFCALEKKEESVMENWTLFRNLSIQHLEETYKRLGVTFSEYHGESMYSEKVLSSLLTQLNNAGLLKQFEGAQVVEVNASKKKRAATLVKSDGSSVYLSRDIAAAIDRFEKYEFDQMFYVVDNGQHDHFSALFQILKLMGKSWHKNLHHVKFGRIRGMSTRSGNVVFLKDILDEAKVRVLKAMKQSRNTKIHDNFEQVADVLATSAVFVNDMKYRRIKDYDFEWEKILRITGESGINLQYTHARLCSLQEKCGFVLEDFDVEILKDDDALKLVSCLSRFDQVVQQSYSNLEPCHLVKYLFELSHYISCAIRNLQVKDQEASVAQARLALFTAAQLVMKNGLKMLGLNPLSKM